MNTGIFWTDRDQSERCNELNQIDYPENQWGENPKTKSEMKKHINATEWGIPIIASCRYWWEVGVTSEMWEKNQIVAQLPWTRGKPQWSVSDQATKNGREGTVFPHGKLAWEMLNEV